MLTFLTQNCKFLALNFAIRQTTLMLEIKREFVPEKLKDVYVDFYWSQKKLWNLELVTSEVPIQQIDWILEYPIWYMDTHPIPNSILQNPELDPDHWKRIQASDLNYPLHVLNWKNRLLILDGVHRLLKAKLSGLDIIKAKILNENHIPNILATAEDFETGYLKQFKK